MEPHIHTEEKEKANEKLRYSPEVEDFSRRTSRSTRSRSSVLDPNSADTKDLRAALPQTVYTSGRPFQLQLPLRLGTPASSFTERVIPLESIPEGKTVKQVTKLTVSSADTSSTITPNRTLHATEKENTDAQKSPDPAASDVTTQLRDLDIDETTE